MGGGGPSSLRQQWERMARGAVMGPDSSHWPGRCHSRIRGCVFAGGARGRGCLKTAHEQGDSLISASVADFQRSVKSPSQGMWPLAPSNGLYIHFHISRAPPGRLCSRVPGTLPCKGPGGFHIRGESEHPLIPGQLQGKILFSFRFFLSGFKTPGPPTS